MRSLAFYSPQNARHKFPNRVVRSKYSLWIQHRIRRKLCKAVLRCAKRFHHFDFWWRNWSTSKSILDRYVPAIVHYLVMSLPMTASSRENSSPNNATDDRNEWLHSWRHPKLSYRMAASDRSKFEYSNRCLQEPSTPELASHAKGEIDQLMM